MEMAMMFEDFHHICTEDEMSDAIFEEFVTECRDKGMPRWAAYDAAVHRFDTCGQGCVPKTWKSLNRRWRANIKHLYPNRQKAAHKAMKVKHGVDSFSKLTIGQIYGSVEKIERKMREELAK